MENLEYKIVISAPAKTVWDTMLQEDTYKQWVAKSWPNAAYEGKWAEGEKVKFVCAGQGGTLAELTEVKPYESVVARHIAIINSDGSEDRTSDFAKGWVGIIEAYKFTEQDATTTLTVSIETNPEWKKMFDDGWPTALQELKKLAEGQLVVV